MTDDFELLSNYVSKFNLENLALVSCQLSSMEYFNDWPNEYSYSRPMVNNALSNMFTKALLHSSSSYSKKGKMDRFSLNYVLNSLVQSADRNDIIQSESINPEDKIDLIIHSLFSSQFWYSRNITKEKIGLLFSQYNEIPNEFRKELKINTGEKFLDIPDHINNKIGISLSKYLLSCVYLLYVHHKELYTDYIEPSELLKEQIILLETDEFSQNQVRQELILQLLERSNEFYHLFTFSKKPSVLTRFSFTQILGFLTDSEADAFLNLTSRDINQLREINAKPWHKKGHISQRLTPFERYPILKLDFPCYLIPNLRFFELGITELIRFELQQAFENNNRFHNVMGTVQELLILKLLTQLESSEIIIIKERVYKKNKTEYKGPDFIVIDKGRPILIESKAKQLLLDTRLIPDLEILNKNIEPVVSALVKIKYGKV